MPPATTTGIPGPSLAGTCCEPPGLPASARSSTSRCGSIGPSSGSVPRRRPTIGRSPHGSAPARWCRSTREWRMRWEPSWAGSGFRPPGRSPGPTTGCIACSRGESAGLPRPGNRHRPREVHAGSTGAARCDRCRRRRSGSVVRTPRQGRRRGGTRDAGGKHGRRGGVGSSALRRRLSRGNAARAVRVPPLLSLVDEAWWERATNRSWLLGSRYPFALSRIGVSQRNLTNSGAPMGDAAGRIRRAAHRAGWCRGNE